MAYVAIFCVVLFTEGKGSKIERWTMAAAVLPLSYGMILSGARSSIVTMGFGFAVIAWHRRNIVSFVVFPLCLILALKFGTELTGGAAMDRFSSLLKFEEIYYRNSIPTRIGWEYMLDNPLGGGLGKSGYSVPFFLFGRTGYSDFYTSDGDLGRLMIEMGFVGVFFFGKIMWAAWKTIFDTLNRLRGSPVASLGLASAACFAMSFSSFPSGSPFLSIPMGALTWFFLGTLQKVDELYALETKGTPEVLAEDSDLPQPPPKRFLYYRPKK
jgi:hypothetical protein